MPLADQVDADLIVAMKARDSVRLLTLRLLKAAAKNAEVEKRTPLTEDEYLSIVQRQVKIRREAIGEYERGNRPELAEREQAELAILRKYMPEQLPDEAILEALNEAIVATGASGPGDLGKVMSRVMPSLKGRAEGARINQLARERLASLT